MTLNEEELWYWLCNIRGVGQKRIRKLLREFETPEGIYRATRNALEATEGLSNRIVEQIMLSKKEDNIKNDLAYLSRINGRFISCKNEEYPKRLHELYDAPYGIYVLGKLPQIDKISLAVIGARNCSNYGKEVARSYSKELAEAGIQIISGLARGVDGYAHSGALQGKGYTLGILGSGIDYCYPMENMGLYMQMEREGGVMSEYGLGTKPNAGNFPNRNRLISALSNGVLVVEAKAKSGTLITVDQALEQGRDVFAVPGRVNDPLSKGTNELIKLGAEIGRAHV